MDFVELSSHRASSAHIVRGELTSHDPGPARSGSSRAGRVRAGPRWAACSGSRVRLGRAPGGVETHQTRRRPSRGFVRGLIAVVLAAAAARGPSRGFAAARRRARPSGRGPSTRGPGASLGVAVVPADPPDPLTATTAGSGGRETPEHGPGATPERGAVLVAGDVHGDIRTAAGVIGPGPAPTAPTRAGPGSRHASSARTMRAQLARCELSLTKSTSARFVRAHLAQCELR